MMLSHFTRLAFSSSSVNILSYPSSPAASEPPRFYVRDTDMRRPRPRFLYAVTGVGPQSRERTWLGFQVLT